MARVVTYECDECGCAITVSEAPNTELEPIYCCGMEVTEVSSAQKRPAKKVKKTVKKGTKKVAAKKVAPKKRPSAKKKTSKKSR
jgi:hypothetical protein